MPTDRLILAFHGMTMSGNSLLRIMGPLKDQLEGAGFDVVAPNGGHHMSDEEVTELGRWAMKQFAKASRGQGISFDDRQFWDDGQCYDWFRPETDDETKKKTYRALDSSLAAIREAARERNVVGVLGFSQGCAMAAIVAAMALRGENLVGDGLRFGLFLSGFKPVFDEPKVVQWPVNGDLAGFFLVGDKDAYIAKGHESLKPLADAFDIPTKKLLVVEGLGHRIPHNPDVVRRLVEFAEEHSG